MMGYNIGGNNLLFLSDRIPLGQDTFGREPWYQLEAPRAVHHLS